MSDSATKTYLVNPNRNHPLEKEGDSIVGLSVPALSIGRHPWSFQQREEMWQFFLKGTGREIREKKKRKG